MAVGTWGNGRCPPQELMACSHDDKTCPESIAVQAGTQQQKGGGLLMWEWPFNFPALSSIPLPHQANPKRSKHLGFALSVGHHTPVLFNVHLPRRVSCPKDVERT